MSNKSEAQGEHSKNSASPPVRKRNRIKLVVPAALCEVCQDMAEDILNGEIASNPRWRIGEATWDPSWLTDHHSHSTRLCAVSRWCWLCQLLVLNMAPLFPVSYSVKKTIFSKGFSFDFSSSLTKNVLVESACFTFSEPYNVHTLLDVKTPLIHLPSYYPEHFNERPRTDNSWLGKRISPRADSPCVFALAGRWLGDCNRDHPECHIRCETQLPTRVIDVGSFCSSPFLYVSGGRVAPYVTLSHCWGGTIEVRCTPSNIDRYQDEICFSDLPLTLRDAITPTRRLGFRYVWIDALCIIQDNHDDWAQEAVKMGTYYRNSALTIAAGDARNSNEGLLTARYPEFVQCADIGQYQFPDCTIRHLAIQLCNGGHWDGLDHLEKRGWTLQERVLSPRVLHYTNKGIVWECRKFRLHEKGGSQPTNETFQDLVSRVGHAYEAHELARLWERLISIYSERSLTVASDKLPSISGLAAMFQAAHSGVYLAGIWKHEMPACLLWRRSTSAEAPLEKPSSYQTPSWSWASLDGEVCWQDDESFVLMTSPRPFQGFQVLEAEVRERMPASFAEVTGGHIVAEAVISLTWYFHQDPYPSSEYNQNSTTLSGYLSTLVKGIRATEQNEYWMDSNFSGRACWIMPCMVDTKFTEMAQKKATSGAAYRLWTLVLEEALGTAHNEDTDDVRSINNRPRRFKRVGFAFWRDESLESIKSRKRELVMME